MNINTKEERTFLYCLLFQSHFSGGPIHLDVCQGEFKFHIFPPVRLEKLCHLGLEVQFAKSLMALYDGTI